MTEAELLRADVPTPATMEELRGYIEALVNRPHEYGTCVYAMSMAAVAAFNFVAKALGVTGFQASCADLDILRRTRQMKQGFAVVDYGKLLYPQYLTDKNFPGWQQLVEQNKARLAVEARRLLMTSPDAHPDVLRHWQWLSSRSPLAGATH